jgi:hypothetical protein
MQVMWRLKRPSLRTSLALILVHSMQNSEGPETTNFVTAQTKRKVSNVRVARSDCCFRGYADRTKRIFATNALRENCDLALSTIGGEINYSVDDINSQLC